MQCVERGLVTLDEPLDKHLPELASQPVFHFDEIDGKNLTKYNISEEESKDLTKYSLHPRKNPLTLRHLLLHTSGVGYDLNHPALRHWRESRGEQPMCLTAKVVPAFSTPLLFEPGTQWKYGGGIDWVGVLMCRLTGFETIEKYLIENVFKPLNMDSTTFHIHTKPNYLERFVAPSVRAPDGQLWPTVLPFPFPPGDEYPGNGMYSSGPDYAAILADIISDNPVCLKKETAELLFEPQLEEGSSALEHLYANEDLYEGSAGGFVGDMKINHGLGGVLLMDEVPLTGAPPKTLVWAGLLNIRWWANREWGLAGFYATQVLPQGDKKNTKMAAAFQSGMWKQRRAEA